MNTLDSVCHLIKTIEELTASNILSITLKCKIQIFRHHPSAPNSSGLGWVGECVFATCSLSYSSVHPGLRSTDQLLLAEHSFFTPQPLAPHSSHHCSKYHNNMGNEDKMCQVCLQPEESHRGRIQRMQG